MSYKGEAFFTGFDQDIPMIKIYFAPYYDADSVRDDGLTRYYMCPSCEEEYLLTFSFVDERAKDITAAEMLSYDKPCDRCRMGVTEEQYQARVRRIVSAQEQLLGVVLEE